MPLPQADPDFLDLPENLISSGPPRGLADVVCSRLFPAPNPYLENPVGWVEEELGEYVWSKQDEVLCSVRDNPFTAVYSAHSTGKSHIASRVAAWWEEVHPPEDTFIVTTAPSANQVEGILWRYINALHEDHDLNGRITLGSVPAWKIGSRLIGWGRKPQDLANAEQAATVFQGIHARFLLVIIDEAGGIPKWLWDAINTLVSDEGGHGRVLAIGNPDDPSSHFFTVSMPDSKWHKIRIQAYDSPNYIGREEYTGTEEMEARDSQLPDHVKEALVGPRFVEGAKKDWGEESPLFVSKVLALFPETSEDNLISIRWMREAVERDLSGTAIDDPGQFSLDVAREGQDEAVIYRLRGGWLRRSWAKAGIGDTMKLADKMAKFIDRVGGEILVVVDADGLGAGVYDRLRQRRYKAHEFRGGKKAFNPSRFKNRRSEQYWMLREMFQEGLIDVDPEDTVLQAQLTSIKWSEDAAGRICVETKKEMQKRGFKSPDRGDAAMMVTTKKGVWSGAYNDEIGGVRKPAKSEVEELLHKEW